MLKVIDMWLGWAGSSLDPHEFSNFTEEGNKGVLKLHNQKKKKSQIILSSLKAPFRFWSSILRKPLDLW